MNVRGRDLGSFVVDAQRAVASRAAPATSTNIEWGGEFENKQRAVVGFIALIGQASLNGVLVLSAIDEARIGGLPREEAMMRACVDRLRAVLMTGALAALGWCQQRPAARWVRKPSAA